MREKRARTVARDLVGNAELFLKEAVSYVKKGAPRDWTFALVTLAIAIELLLKAILKSEHWSLLFENLAAASEARLKSGKFKTVGFREALRRAEEIVGIRLADKDRIYILHLIDLRNQILHYEFTLNVEQVKSIAARGLAVFAHLHAKHLDKSSALPVEISKELKGFQHYVALRLRDLRPRLKKLKRPRGHIRACPECFQNTLVLQERDIRCLYCGNELQVEDLAALGEGEGGPCPECDDGILSFVLVNNEEGYFSCVLCGFRPKRNLNTTCSHCGETFWDSVGLGVHKACWEIMMEKD